MRLHIDRISGANSTDVIRGGEFIEQLCGISQEYLYHEVAQVVGGDGVEFVTPGAGTHHIPHYFLNENHIYIYSYIINLETIQSPIYRGIHLLCDGGVTSANSYINRGSGSIYPSFIIL